MKLEKYYLEKANVIRKYIVLMHPPVHNKMIETKHDFELTDTLIE
jgi:hypothetical protein